MPLNTRVLFRATTTDLANASAIASALRSPARPRVTRTDAIRHALAVVAASCPASSAVSAIASTTPGAE